MHETALSGPALSVLRDCGAGGLSLGFKWAGFNSIAANDHFKHCCSTYKHNHPNTALIEVSEGATFKDVMLNLNGSNVNS